MTHPLRRKIHAARDHRPRRRSGRRHRSPRQGARLSEPFGSDPRSGPRRAAAACRRERRGLGRLRRRARLCLRA